MRSLFGVLTGIVLTSTYPTAMASSLKANDYHLESLDNLPELVSPRILHLHQAGGFVLASTSAHLHEPLALTSYVRFDGGSIVAIPIKNFLSIGVWSFRDGKLYLAENLQESLTKFVSFSYQNGALFHLEKQGSSEFVEELSAIFEQYGRLIGLRISDED
jgi:hypothetical protein